MPLRFLRSALHRVPVWLRLACLLQTATVSPAQVLLPPDPAVSMGNNVAFSGFVDEMGRAPAALAGQRPSLGGPAWIVSPMYAGCPHTCSPLTAGLHRALERSDLDASEVRVVSFSFDPSETAERLQGFRARMNLPPEWLMLRATDPSSLDRLLRALDFRTIRTADGEFQHPNLIVVLTPDLRLADYLFGVEFSPMELASAVRRARKGLNGGPTRSRLFLVSAVGLGVSALVFLSLLMRRWERRRGFLVRP